MAEPETLVDYSLAPARGWREQFVRYVVVGGIAFLFDFGVYRILEHHLGFHYQWAGVAGFMVGIATNYLLSIFWVFNKRSSPNAFAEFAIFLTVGVIGLGINAAILWLLIDVVAWYSPLLSFVDHKVMAKVVAAGVVLVWNFAARKILLFS